MHLSKALYHTVRYILMDRSSLKLIGLGVLVWLTWKCFQKLPPGTTIFESEVKNIKVIPQSEFEVDQSKCCWLNELKKFFRSCHLAPLGGTTWWHYDFAKCRSVSDFICLFVCLFVCLSVRYRPQCLIKFDQTPWICFPSTRIELINFLHI